MFGRVGGLLCSDFGGHRISNAGVNWRITSPLCPPSKGDYVGARCIVPLRIIHDGQDARPTSSFPFTIVGQASRLTSAQAH